MDLPFFVYTISYSTCDNIKYMRRNLYSEEDVDHWVDLHSSGIPFSRIAKEVGAHEYTIAKRLRTRGITSNKGRPKAIFCTKCGSDDRVDQGICYECTRSLKKDCKYRRTYGISLKDFETMLVDQDNRCAICRTDTYMGHNWHVDHSHKTGQVRGILCANCNTALGKFQDSVDILESAISYLLR